MKIMHETSYCYYYYVVAVICGEDYAGRLCVFWSYSLDVVIGDIYHSQHIICLLSRLPQCCSCCVHFNGHFVCLLELLWWLQDIIFPFLLLSDIKLFKYIPCCIANIF
jgi:hypothetical protein